MKKLLEYDIKKGVSLLSMLHLYWYNQGADGVTYAGKQKEKLTHRKQHHFTNN